MTGTAASTTRPLRARHVDVSLEGRLGNASRWQVAFYDRDETDVYRRPASEPRVAAGRFVAEVGHVDTWGGSSLPMDGVLPFVLSSAHPVADPEHHDLLRDPHRLA